MKIKILSLAPLLIISLALHSQIINREPLSSRLTGYLIDVKLDTEAKQITGTLEAYWVNFTAEEVPDIRLHMYMNAFKSRNSTVYRESGRSPGSRNIDRGWIDIISFSDNRGTDLLPFARYISPDDANPNDSTTR